MVVLFDFDEVFVDLNSGALKYINKELETNYTLDDVKSWDFFDQPMIRKPFLDYLSLPNVYQEHVIPNKKMIGVLKQMIEMGQEAYIVTASIESSEQSKYKFIKEHMSFFDTKRLFTVNSSSKYKMKSDVLDELSLNYHEPIVLVDDGIHNILDMMADIKHKEKLDGLMRRFYNNRDLKKYNNPYHEFIYGIVPVLTYNKDLEGGKRIFKLKETKDIWGIFKKIEEQHTLRVQNKQAEAFNYLNNIINDLLPAETFKQVNELQNNVSFLTKTVLNHHNKHADFLSDIARFSVKLEHIIEQNGVDNLNNKHNLGLKSRIIDSVFKSADVKFGSDIMYQEIKSLAILHAAKNDYSEKADMGIEVSKVYGINTKQLDLFSKSLISTIIDISKENLEAARKLSAEPLSNKDEISYLFNKSGVMSNINFEDKSEILANSLLAFNKNFKFNKETNLLEVKDQEIEDLRKSCFEKMSYLSKKVKIK